jgi:hypothetical protein
VAEEKREEGQDGRDGGDIVNMYEEERKAISPLLYHKHVRLKSKFPLPFPYRCAVGSNLARLIDLRL